MTDSSAGTSAGTSRRLRCAALAAVSATALAPVAVVPVSAEAASGLTATWSAPSVRAGGRSVVTVKGRSLPAGSSAVLQRRFPDRWRVVDDTAERTDAGLRLTVPTDQFGRFTFRVAARRSGEVVATSPRQRVTVRTGYDPRGRSRQHAFLNGQRTRWDSCRIVRWKFDGSLAPRRGLHQVKAAVRRIHAATGIEFEYRGRTDDKANPYGEDVAGAAVVVGWRSARTFRRYGASAQVVGLAGQKYASGYRDADGAVYRTVQAGVILNAGHRLHRGFGRGTTWGEVIVHELGHVMGLDHAGARAQVMYYSTTPHNADLGAGDLAGLRKLGDTRGCLRRTSARVTTGQVLVP